MTKKDSKKHNPNEAEYSDVQYEKHSKKQEKENRELSPTPETNTTQESKKWGQKKWDIDKEKELQDAIASTKKLKDRLEAIQNELSVLKQAENTTNITVEPLDKNGAKAYSIESVKKSIEGILHSMDGIIKEVKDLKLEARGGQIILTSKLETKLMGLTTKGNLKAVFVSNNGKMIMDGCNFTGDLKSWILGKFILKPELKKVLGGLGEEIKTKEPYPVERIGILAGKINLYPNEKGYKEYLENVQRENTKKPDMTTLVSEQKLLEIKFEEETKKEEKLIEEKKKSKDSTDIYIGIPKFSKTGMQIKNELKNSTLENFKDFIENAKRLALDNPENKNEKTSRDWEIVKEVMLDFPKDKQLNKLEKEEIEEIKTKIIGKVGLWEEWVKDPEWENDPKKKGLYNLAKNSLNILGDVLNSREPIIEKILELPKEEVKPETTITQPETKLEIGEKVPTESRGSSTTEVVGKVEKLDEKAPEPTKHKKHAAESEIPIVYQEGAIDKLNTSDLEKEIKKILEKFLKEKIGYHLNKQVNLDDKEGVEIHPEKEKDGEDVLRVKIKIQEQEKGDKKNHELEAILKNNKNDNDIEFVNIIKTSEGGYSLTNSLKTYLREPAIEELKKSLSKLDTRKINNLQIVKDGMLEISFKKSTVKKEK